MVLGIPVVSEEPTTENSGEKPTEKPDVKPTVLPVVKPTENPEVTPVATADTVVLPKVSDLPITAEDEIGDGYVIHTVKEGEKTKHLLRRWGVSEEEFRKKREATSVRGLLPIRITFLSMR